MSFRRCGGAVALTVAMTMLAGAASAQAATPLQPLRQWAAHTASGSHDARAVEGRIARLRRMVPGAAARLRQAGEDQRRVDLALTQTMLAADLDPLLTQLRGDT